ILPAAEAGACGARCRRRGRRGRAPSPRGDHGRERRGGMSELGMPLTDERDASACGLLEGLARPPRAERASAVRRRRQIVDRVARWIIGAVAFSAIAAVVLIFAFVLREALPLFTDAVVREEVTPARMVLPQAWKEGAAPSFSW